MEQLTLELATPEPPTFTNFVAGANREAVAMLCRVASGALQETGVVLWGAAGAGKTHLLRATVAAAANADRPARYLPQPASVEASPFASAALICVDAVDAADAGAQGRLFTLYNALAASRGQLVVAAGAAPARLALRDDLRTRLAHGLVYEIVPLADTDKAQALGTYARERGFQLPTEAIDYLLAHGRRDMATDPDDARGTRQDGRSPESDSCNAGNLGNAGHEVRNAQDRRGRQDDGKEDDAQEKVEIKENPDSRLGACAIDR